MIKKNVLLIAYHYPPFGQTSSRRSGCMAKYLPHFGWQPFVLTREWTQTNGPYDPTITTGIPDDVIVNQIACDTQTSSMVGRIKKRFSKTLFPQKDPIEFYKPALKSLPGMVHKHKIDIIWATFPLLSNLALAAHVSKATGIPWVADFRDVNQFVDSIGEALMLPSRLLHLTHIIKSASAVVTVSDGFAKTLAKRHKKDAIVIPNGFDPDIMTSEQSNTFPKFEIVYTGGLELGHPDLTPLLDALHHLCKTGKMNSNDILVTFYGKGNEQRLARLFRHPFSQIVRNCGGVYRTESLQRQRSALILLQTTVPGTGWMTSKIYEYLIARRPILAIPRDGDSVEKLIRETQTGVSCSTKDEITDQLMDWYGEWKKTGTITWEGNMEAIMKYSRKAQAEETSQLFKKVLVSRSG